MPTPAEQPRVDQPVVDQKGRVTRAWQDYFLRMSSRSSQEDLAAIVAEIQRRVAELESGQSLNFRIFGEQSIIVNGVVQPNGVVVITLEGDQDAPGNTRYYGTGPTGAKGWFTVESAIAVTADLTKAVDGAGVATLGLADLANSGVGAALAKITRDAKGRVSGTAAATTDDLPQGAVNKYFPEAPLDGGTYGRKDGAWAIPAHNGLASLQGGTTSEYYHATAAQNAALAALAISGYIDGFRMVWNSGTSVTFESGTAAIQSSGTLLRSPTAVTKSGLSLAASTVVHAYAYSNSGTADIELSTTAPAAAYIGTARSKTGDTSRRYIGSLLTDATGAIFNFSNDGRSVFYLVNVAQAPFRVLNAGTSATWTLVSFAGALPPTVTNAIVNITAAGTAVSRVRPAGGTYVGNGRLYGLSPGALAFGPLPMNGGPQAEYIADAGGACSVDVLGYDFAR